MVANLKIILRIGNEEKAFIPEFLSAMAFRKVFDMQKLLDKGDEIGGSDVDEIVNYICTVFNSKFTIDEFYNGLSMEDFMPTMLSVLENIVNIANSKIKN